MPTTTNIIRQRGRAIYTLYKLLTTTLTPLVHLHLHWRRFRGLEHSHRWPERLGRPSLPRPSGPLLWFHAVSLGEGKAAIPVIRRCMQERPDFNILMTSTTLSAFETLKNQLPPAVIYQFAPLDVPSAVEAFLGHWKPNAIILFENELWPNLVINASENKITLALINARMSEKSFKRWSMLPVFPLMSLMLSKFSLIIPLSKQQGILFQLLQASPYVIGSSVDLKYSVGECASLKSSIKDVEDLHIQLSHRPAWMAASVHKGEDEVMLQAHKALVLCHPKLLTVMVPRHAEHGLAFAERLKNEGFKVAVRSIGDKLTAETDVYMVNTLGELQNFYGLMPIAVIGGSFLPSLAGHNVSEAAAAGSAVLTGCHVGHFSHMVSAMQRFDPLSIWQVSRESELVAALHELLGDPMNLLARQSAAKQTFHNLSGGVLAHVWSQLNQFVLSQLPVCTGK